MKTIVYNALLSALAVSSVELYAIEIGPHFVDGTHSMASYDSNSLGRSIRVSIEEGNLEVYKTAMSRLLVSEDTEHFLQAVFASNRNGQNMFHIMANVQDPEAQEFFAKELQTLLSVFTGKALPDKASLGGLLIDPPLLGDIPAVRDFLNSLSKKESETFTGLTENDVLPLKEEIRQRVDGPAIEFIRFLYAENSEGLTLIEVLPKTSLAPVTPIQDVADRIKKVREPLQAGVNEEVLFLHEKRQDWHKTLNLPIDIAFARGNTPVYKVLRSFGGTTTEPALFPQVFVGVLSFVLPSLSAGYYIGMISPMDEGFFDSLPKLLVGVAVASGIMIGSVALTRKCQQVIRRNSKVKRWLDTPVF